MSSESQKASSTQLLDTRPPFLDILDQWPNKWTRRHACASMSPSSFPLQLPSSTPWPQSTCHNLPTGQRVKHQSIRIRIPNPSWMLSKVCLMISTTSRSKHVSVSTCIPISFQTEIFAYVIPLWVQQSQLVDRQPTGPTVFKRVAPIYRCPIPNVYSSRFIDWQCFIMADVFSFGAKDVAESFWPRSVWSCRAWRKDISQRISHNHQSGATFPVRHWWTVP